MYDYLAKIILLGPSGAGKYVSLLFLPDVNYEIDLVYFMTSFR
jgi:hypothetical protein